jgi:glycosyltransferase involved in cell wall biosynthesis
MPRKPNLLLFNYVMDSQDPLLSHQLEAVKSLAGNFTKVTVITGKVGSINVPENVRVIDSKWVPGHRFRSLFSLIIKSTPVILRGNFRSVFFHMTDLQCAILSPLLWVRRRRQYLWYAHTGKSLYLRWSAIWINLIVTSTPGSCPLKGSKIIAIGQAIDSRRFTPIPLTELDLNKLIHIGRFDRSKNIESLIQAAVELREEFEGVKLSLVGSPANQESQEWAQNLKQSYSKAISNGWLSFSDSIPRERFRVAMTESGCFIHAYLGSLDKTLVESTMLRVPVVTINPEYIKIFGQWGAGSELSLADEYRALRKLGPQELDSELLRRYLIAESNHSLKNWTSQLSRLLQ